MNPTLLTLALCWIAAVSINAEQTASFYGSSFASLVLQDSSSGSGVDTRFRFKTRSEDALLLLAASGADYCIIELKRGTLKVRLKLASISKEFSLGGQERCNDLRWHEVMVFYKSGHNVSIALDQQYTTHQLPVTTGALSSLDHPGQKTTVYVGSLGGYAGPLSTGRPPNFRGCLESLYYNNINVFHRVQANKKTSGGVLYELEFEHRCPTLFEASNTDAISFTDAQQSFIALPTLPDCSQGLQLNMQFQSSTSRGLLAYQSGRRSVLALELDDGRVNLLFKFGGELHTLTSPHRVTDAHWHKLQVELQANGSVVFYVDTNKITWDANSTRTTQTLNDDCSFDTHFYVGGVDAKNRARAQAQGVKPFQYSLAGCVHYMRLNSKPIGLEDALVTKAVSKDCVWKYPCLKEPCLPEADCLQVGIDSFQCVCDKKICTKKSFTANYKETYATSADEESPGENVLAVTPVVVHDGGVEHLSPEHIQLLVDLPKLGLRPGDIHFTVLVGPNHGVLSNERTKTPSEVTTFTYRDITRYRVVYTHDGSETANDTVVLEMSVEPSTLLLQRLPKALLEKMQFMLHIAILTPQNSPSSHNYDSQATLTLARLTKKAISNELLKVDDVQFVDENAAKFMVHIEDPENTGFVDNFKNPGQAIESFTFQEMKQGTIWFNHRGNSTSASFGLTYTSPAQTKEMLIEIRTFPLEIRMVNNTGVQASYVTPTIMTNQMLAFVTNAPEQGLDIRFDMIQLPKYGTIQRLKNNSVWTNTSHFSQRQLTRHKVRYVPIPRAARDQPLEDNIGFVVSCEKAKLSTHYAFKLNFTTDRIFVTTNNTRIIHDTKQITLTEKDLKYVDGAEARITYTLTATPKLGKLLLNGVVLTVGSNFTQRHLAQRNLVYRPSKSVIFFEDTFKFNVFSSGSSTSLLGQTFTLRSANSDSLIVANMRVPEGERLALKLAKPAHKNKYTVKISGLPKHGNIERSESNAFHVVLQFPTEDVGNGQIFYKHDDSESMHDKVIYELYKDNATEPFQKGEVNIDISLKNDNPPKRTQEQVFHIAYQAEKILSNIYLRYEDADTDTDPSKISISRKEIPNAMLVRNDDSRKEVQQFTQKDIDDEMILIRHTGGDYGRAVFWVSDGQFYATGILEIVASPPYLNITTNTGLLLEQGSSALLLPSNLSLDTNLNVKPSEVVFEVTKPPTLGKLRFAQSSDEFIDKFTLRDIQEGIIEYVHLSSNKNAHNDVFDFVAVALGVRKEDSFKITVYPTTFWTPMELRAGGGNQTLFLDVGSTATVSRTYLNVVHETLEPEDIVFTVIRKPHSGKLQIEGKVTSTFTQADINKGKLKYAHSAQAGQDSFVVDVTNGFSQMTGLEVRIGAVLREISLRTQNLTVDEGSKVTLTVEYLSLPAETGSLDVISEYLIIEPPKHGAIVSKSKDVVNSFQPIQLQRGEIEYDHNGDESLVDFFTVIGRASAMGKETAPATIHVKVLPVNDEVPQVVENTGLELWEGEWAIISSDHLAVIDEDTPPEDLRFMLTQPPSNGFVAVNSQMQPVLSFTQAEINRNVIVFTHTGAEAGGFKFQVDDGVNTLSGQQFIVRAKEITVNVSRNEKLRVEPRGQQSITTDHLQAVSSLPLSNTNAQIIYTLIEPPKFGRIVREKLDGTLEAIQEFTQAEIDQTLVLYENTGATKNDSFMFSVSTNKGKLNLKSHTFTIDVSPKSIIDSPVVVQAKEGDLVALKNEVLALGNVLPKANVTVIRQPSHGWIGLDGPKGVEPTETFTDDDISHGRVWYNHDDSETFEDKFVVSVQRLDKAGAEPLNISIFVEIAPVNDQPPVLKTESPSIEIVEGQSTTLTSEMLFTEDADNITSQIVYNLEYTDLVTFVKNDSNPVWTFTQQDVDEMRISVSCNNTEANAIFEIKFQVDDGMYNAQKAVLTITVRPPSLSMAKNSEVILTQGSFYREITTFELDVDTDSRREECWYDVVQPPENGHVHVYGNNTTLFRQEDVDMGNVQYVQVNNMSATEDFFIVDVHCQSSTLKGIRVNVSVIALVNQERLLEVPLNSRGVIGKRHLDATKIATKHQSNPRFHITRKPLNGIVGKVGVGPVDQFSHEDVLNSLVYYQSRSGDAPSEDSFEFKLCSPGVQPGKGQLIIVVTRPVGASEPPSTTQSVLPTIEVPIASTTSVSLLELDRSQMHQVILLLSLVFIAVIVITIAFAILLCKVVRMSSSSSCKSQGGASNSSTYVSNSGFLEQDEVDRFIAQTAPPPPPQCRVTPMLEPVILDYTSSLQEMSLQDCASGNEETDSKEGATSSPLPVLRKNQYWV